MQEFNNQRIQLKFGIKGWMAIGVGVAILGAITTAVVLLAVGLFVFTLPMLILAPLIYWLVPKRKPENKPIQHPLRMATSNNTEIIEGEFRVIDRDDDNNQR
jgi:4-hydroxybenzoate polyprenyltransferase